MYTVTFYSFKGGVGRTMALVNIGVELARTGRRVLMVDFDLEAPGLETFEALKPAESPLGVVDYVTEYLEADQAPDVSRFVYECPTVAQQGGALWVMPAGRRDAGYARRLNAINWADLYDARDGYLMIEDLKEQWRQHLAPDYVLIDSRTGHTDAGGICTRQLPDAVVILFFPNDQNLAGLQKVVADVRAEIGSRRRPISLHFVNSNVPDLDDEDRILEERLARFQQALGYDALTGTIHHYGSLALLNQMIFTVSKPRSRLAQEYRQLMTMLARDNPEDREGAITFLRAARSQGGPSLRWRDSTGSELADRGVDRHGHRSTAAMDGGVIDLEERLAKIKSAHKLHGDVLFELAVLQRDRGSLAEAVGLLGDAIAAGYQAARVFRLRLELNRLLGEDTSTADARADAKAVLAAADASYSDLAAVVPFLRVHEPEALYGLEGRPAFRALAFGERCSLLEGLLWEKLLPIIRPVADALLKQLPDSPASERDQVGSLALALMAIQRFEDVKRVISPTAVIPGNLSIQDVFNYAMAEWAVTGVPPASYFGRVLEIDRETPREESDPNYVQCIAIALWATGEAVASLAQAQRAKELLLARRRTVVFSAWRYLNVGSSDFVRDVDAFRSMVEGHAGRPAFMIPRGIGGDSLLDAN